MDSPRGIGGGLTFVATAAGAVKGQASWILRYRFGGAAREKVLGCYPDLSLKDAREASRQRWLNRDELTALAKAMQDTSNFGRQNELAVWLLLALCVRKMELLSARWTEFDLARGVWSPCTTCAARPAPTWLRWAWTVSSPSGR